MSIEREIDHTEKLIPTEIKISGERLDYGEGRIFIQQAWRDPNGVLRGFEEKSYLLSDELQEQQEFAGITATQVLAFFAAYFESKNPQV
jgi:hypothetical protein